MKLRTSTTNNLQSQILDHLISVINEGLLPSQSRRPGFGKNNRFYEQFLSLNRKQLFYKIFDNFRMKNGQPCGLRLTYLGNELLNRNFDCFEFKHDINPTPKMYLVLDRKMTWPYYFTKKKIVLYCQEDASWYKLNGNDIEAFLEVI